MKSSSTLSEFQSASLKFVRFFIGTFIRKVTLSNKDSYLDPFLIKTLLHTEQTQTRQLLNEPTDQGLLCLLMEICSYTGGPTKYRLRAKIRSGSPPREFADISCLEENFKPHLLRDVCTLCSGALVPDSLLHMLL